MKLAKKKMDRYYSLTDDSSAYRIAMVLHPGFKLEYFQQHDWESDWIEEAKNLTQDEYMCTYENRVEPFEDMVEVQRGAEVCTRCNMPLLLLNY